MARAPLAPSALSLTTVSVPCVLARAARVEARNARPTEPLSAEAAVNYLVALACAYVIGLVSVATFDATGRILALSFEFGVVAGVLILVWIYFNDSDVDMR